ncbi:MAG TPA: DUF1501 domain-containing protein [Pirellulales bacterium]|jgi:hypothetical protein|nr:DUF1501 domain-containing protein [Pirellulales bacterium]
MLQPIVDASVSPEGAVSRRGFLRRLAAGVGAAGVTQLGWRDMVIARADELRRAGKSMILLWMDGGPSQYDTFNPKIGSEFQGPATAINTTIPGIQFAEYWPQTAASLDRIALVRSMVSKEKEHDRAIALVRTGYPPSESLRYPAFGSIVARARDDSQFDLPAFVRVGRPRITTRDVDAGVLGVQYNPFKIDEPGKLPPNLVPTVSPDVLRRRLSLGEKFDGEFARSGAPLSVAQKKLIYDRASRFVLSSRVKAFDLADEPDKLRDAYGRSTFGQGCLLARRLVEQGVSFVEVISTGSKSDQGWDTHKLGFEQNPLLCREVDPAYAALLADLHDRGMLDNTLVVWMGEFCRTPKLKSDGGRDHYSEGWLVGLSGAGVKTGQVIGATDSDGVHVTDRPIGVQDLFVTFCHILGLNPREEYYTSDNRPLKLVDGGELIGELV